MSGSLVTLEVFKEGYSKWLMSVLGMESHTELFWILYDLEFTWILPLDESKSSNGIRMRDRYAYEEGKHLPDGWMDHPCSFLEMTASLAFAMEESFLYDPNTDDGVDTWFRILMENCGLWELDDEAFEDDWEWCAAEAEGIAFTIMQRRYASDGEGGLFPLDDPKEDQRTIEIGQQMNSYIVENWVL